MASLKGEALCHLHLQVQTPLLHFFSTSLTPIQ
jgi:hypothetical protein